MMLLFALRGCICPVAFLFVLAKSTGVLAAADGGPRITLIDAESGGGNEGGSGDLSESSRGDGTLGGMAPGGDLMQQLLNWGIEHSDPEKLKELMQKYQDNNLTIKDVYGQDVLDALFVNEASVMQGSIKQVSSFSNESVLDEELEGALTTLRDLVEQVDNAGNLHRMGGLRPLLDLGAPPLFSSSSELLQEVEDVASIAERRSSLVRASALWTLGVAVQNNEPVQADLLSLDGVARLVSRLSLCPGGDRSAETDAEEHKILRAESSEYCSKLLFAISGLVRNNATTWAVSDGLGLFSWLIDAGVSHENLGLAKKALALLDIALAQNPDLPFLGLLVDKQAAFAATLLQRLRRNSEDLDVTDKVLRLVTRLLSLRPMLFALDFRQQLTTAVSDVLAHCERLHGAGDELCTSLDGLARHADAALAAREVTDDEL